MHKFLDRNGNSFIYAQNVLYTGDTTPFFTKGASYEVLRVNVDELSITVADNSGPHGLSGEFLYDNFIVHVPVEVHTGMKFDSGKLLMTPLFETLAGELESVAAVLTYGAQKYEKDSWRYVLNAEERYSDAAHRHRTLRAKGEVYDEESGLPHIAHELCNLLFVFYLQKERGAFDKGMTNFNKPPARQ